MKKNTKRKTDASSSKEGLSTRQLILEQANLMINGIGVVDFRIDKLASALGLSPGNITYHFPKKEDISNALWDQCISECASACDYYMTPLLDIKQLYLFSRSIAATMLRYKGVLCYKLGDIGVINRSEKRIHEIMDESGTQYQKHLEVLSGNGYLKLPGSDPVRRLTLQSLLLTSFWWINHSVMCYPDENPEKLVDRYAFMMIYPLKPFLTERGFGQFSDIIDSLKKNK